MSQPESFDHEVSVELAELIPEAIREDPDKRKEYVDLALSYGLKAIIQTQGGVDKSAIRDEFERWKKEVSDKLIGEDSDFEQGLDDWLTNPDGTFQKAFDLTDPDSLMSKFMTEQTTDRTTHEGAMTTLVGEIKDLISKDAAPKQAKEEGDNFEAELEEFLTIIKSAEDEVTSTGEEAIKGSGGVKKGDLGLLVGHPTANDLMITIEAKAGKSAGLVKQTADVSKVASALTSFRSVPMLAADLTLEGVGRVRIHRKQCGQNTHHFGGAARRV